MRVGGQPCLPPSRGGTNTTVPSPCEGGLEAVTWALPSTDARLETSHPGIVWLSAISWAGLQWTTYSLLTTAGLGLCATMALLRRRRRTQGRGSSICRSAAGQLTDAAARDVLATPELLQLILERAAPRQFISGQSEMIAYDSLGLLRGVLCPARLSELLMVRAVCTSLREAFLQVNVFVQYRGNLGIHVLTTVKQRIAKVRRMPQIVRVHIVSRRGSRSATRILRARAFDWPYFECSLLDLFEQRIRPSGLGTFHTHLLSYNCRPLCDLNASLHTVADELPITDIHDMGGIVITIHPLSYLLERAPTSHRARGVLAQLLLESSVRLRGGGDSDEEDALQQRLADALTQTPAGPSSSRRAPARPTRASRRQRTAQETPPSEAERLTIGDRVVRIPALSTASANRVVGSQLAYVPLQLAGREADERLLRLRAELERVVPDLDVLDQMRPINGNRVIYPILMRTHPSVVHSIFTYFSHSLIHHARAAELQDLARACADGEGQMWYLGAQLIIPRLAAGRLQSEQQSFHTDVAGRGRVLTLAIHLRGHALNTLVRAPDGLYRADAGAFAFDSGIEHAAPRIGAHDSPQSRAGNRYVLSRAFVLFAHGDATEAEVRSYLEANGLTLEAIERPTRLQLMPARPTTRPDSPTTGDSTAAGTSLGKRPRDSNAGSGAAALTWPPPERGSAIGHVTEAVAHGRARRAHPSRAGRPWTSAQLAALRTYEWPLTTIPELRRLLRDPTIAPTYLCGCEFSGAMRSALERELGVIALSVDTRASLDSGFHYQGKLQDVLELEHLWEGAILWPPCTHQTMSDTTAQADKLLDGRAFWGISFFIYCLARPLSPRVVVEQPDTIIPTFYDASTRGYHRQRVRPSFFGDAAGKPINLTARGLPPLIEPSQDPGAAEERRFFDFADGEERDRWRSSWGRHPKMCTALARWLGQPVVENAPPSQVEELHVFMRAWHAAGLPLPEYCGALLGESPSEETRVYQGARGCGDGRRPPGQPLPAAPGTHLPSQPDARQDRPSLTRWAVDSPHLHLSVAQLTRSCVCVFYVCYCAQPLILAHARGLRLLGVDLGDSAPRGAPLEVARHMASSSMGIAALAMLAGRFTNGPELAVVPVERPSLAETLFASARRQRTAARAGHDFCWLRLDALRSTPVYELAFKAVLSLAVLAAPLASGLHYLHPRHGSTGTTAAFGSYAIGRAEAGAVAVEPRWPSSSAVDPVAALALCATWGEQLASALLAAGGAEAPYLADWAERIRPLPASELPPDLLSNLPTFDDARLDAAPLPPIDPPLVTSWVPRMPSQPASVHCPQSPLDLYRPAARARIQARMGEWLRLTLADLECVRDLGDGCDRIRPRPIAIGAEGMFDWSRDIVWDFTFERDPVCGVPLDFDLPLDTHLDLQYLERRLHDYPDQQLVSYLLQGVRLEAHVELHSVWVPHLTSLSKGYESVARELQRLTDKGWYHAFGHVPFWPCYLNGQGATARKLEPWRFRRTTEGGGPRRETFDETGLRAWSINDASKVYHLPRHLRDSPRDDVRRWVRNRGLLTPPEERPPLTRGSKWDHEAKPTLGGFMRSLGILRRAAHVLGEPIYIFSDDGADWFNQLALSPESWPLFNVAFLESETPEGEPPRLRFTSERRLGFGCHPASKIAQRFSDALLVLFRADMDAAEAASPDPNPALPNWLAARKAVALSSGQTETHESRLYSVVMYSDDPAIAVVGVERAVRALRLWRRLTEGLNLEMAIPEKRVLGTWTKWLGVLLIVGLGVVVIPRDKILRATAAIEQVLKAEADFGTYRSLIGLLEHIRGVLRAPGSRMYGLYEPHAREEADPWGPSRPVVPSGLMMGQLRRWQRTLSTIGGVPLASSFGGYELQRTAPLYVTAADAATDCEHPGLGGFLHGMWWHLPLTPRVLNALHITALELLATGLNAIIFAPYLEQQRRVLLMSDALCAPYVLQKHARSPALGNIHRRLMDNVSFNKVAERAQCVHCSGDANLAADCASRYKVELLRVLCRHLGVRMVRVEVPPAATQLLLDVVSEEELLRAPGTRRGRQFALDRAAEHRLRQAQLAESAAQSALAKRRRPNPTTADAAEAGGDAIRFKLYAPVRRRPYPTSPSAAMGALHARLLSGTTPSASIEVPPGVEEIPDLSPVQQLLRERAIAERRPNESRVVVTSARALPADLPLPASRGSPPRRRDRPLLREAGQRQAAQRATAWSGSPIFRDVPAAKLETLLKHTQAVSEFGAAESTLTKDEIAWRHWTDYSKYLGFNPDLRARDTLERPHEVGALLAGFLLYVYPRMKGKGGRSWAKPNSAFQYVLALLRCFRRWDVPMPSAKAVKDKLKGLMRAFCDAYGPLAVAATRKEPMLFSMVATMLRVPMGTNVHGMRWVLTDPYVRHARCLALLMFRTGNRLGDLINPSACSKRSDLTWVIGGREVIDPTRAQLLGLKVGDQARLGPGCSKTDQFGEVHAPFGTTLPYRTGGRESLCAAAELALLELESPCEGAARADTPLFADEHGQLLSHRKLDDVLRRLLLHCFGTAAAAVYSWHSFRSGLACALAVAGANDATIQLLCRWMSADSLRLYRRMGSQEMISWADKAERSHVDTIQLPNIPIVDAADGFGPLLRRCDVDLTDREATLQELTQPLATARAPARKRQRTADEPSDDEDDHVPDTSPLTADNATGRRVLVPAHVWPAYACNERGGAGWEAIVRRASSDHARVEFVRARTGSGRRYADADLLLTALQPI